VPGAVIPAFAGDESPPGPTSGQKPLQDNSFFIEEAYNQEPGVVQNIFGGLWSRSVQGGRRNDRLSLTFTQEWPVPGVRHQLSYTLPYTWLWQEGSPGDEGFNDVFLNYRYQLLEESDDRPAVAPRLSALLPTGDAGKGLGKGGAGLQVGLPVSKRFGLFAAHLNSGTTIVPDAEVDLPGNGQASGEFLVDFTMGFGLIYFLRPELNILAEFAAGRFQQLDFEIGEKVEVRQMVFSPGVRYGIDLRGDYQLVLGAAVPLGLTSETDDYGAFLYLSLEGPIWKAGD
jgi:hypothetical protein